MSSRWGLSSSISSVFNALTQSQQQIGPFDTIEQLNSSLHFGDSDISTNNTPDQSIKSNLQPSATQPRGMEEEEVGEEDEFHLSVDEVGSLQFGEPSQDNISLGSAASSPSHARTRSSSREGTQFGTPASRPRMSSSQIGRSPLPQTQFSPLSLAPSPLIGFPPLPPPPEDSPTTRQLLGQAPLPEKIVVRPILRAPRTPGTGRSVRFSSSTTSRDEPGTSPIIARFADAESAQDQEEQEWEENSVESADGGRSREPSAEGSVLDHGSSAEASFVDTQPDATHTATFLSKLQAAIPSPENSFAHIDPTAVAASPVGPVVNVMSPASEPPSFVVAQGGRALFDESNPFSTSQSFQSSVGDDWSVREALRDLDKAGLPVLVEEDEPKEDSFEDALRDSRGASPTVNFSRTFAATPRASTLPSPQSEPHSFEQATPSAGPRSTSPTFDLPELPPPPPISPIQERRPRTMLHSPANTTVSADRSDVYDTPPNSSRKLTSGSFYRKFMERRASESAFAADELGRLVERGETPGREKSVYVTPGADILTPDSQREYGTQSPSPMPPVAAIVEEVVQVVEDEDDSLDLAELVESPEWRRNASVDHSVVREITPPSSPVKETEHDLLATPAIASAVNFLSPISERSEPNTSIDSPGSAYAYTPASPTITFKPVPATSAALTLYGSTTEKEIPQVVAPSPNPFALQDGLQPSDQSLIQSLLATTGEALQNSSSQRFLLSSLLSNLRDELARKDAMLANALAQRDELEQGWQNAVQEIELWEQERARDHGTLEKDAAKIETLEQLVGELTKELELRVGADREGQKKASKREEEHRAAVAQAKAEVRELEIRDRHTAACLRDAEEGRARAEDEREHLVHELEAARPLRGQVQEHERTILALRAQLARAEADSRVFDSEQHEAERVKIEEQFEERERNIREQYEHELVALREELKLANQRARATEDEAAQLSRESAQELEQLDAQLASARDELREATRARMLLEQDVADTQAALSSVQTERDRLVDEANAREEVHAEEKASWRENLAAVDRLMETTAELDQDVKSRNGDLIKAREEIADLREKCDELQDASLRVQEHLAVEVKKKDIARAEAEKLQSEIAALKRNAMDRDGKISRLKKKVGEMEEDVFGLNLALEAKQHEAQLWKRRVSNAAPPKIERPTNANFTPITKGIEEATPSKPAVPKALSGPSYEPILKGLPSAPSGPIPQSAKKAEKREEKRRGEKENSRPLAGADTPARPGSASRERRRAAGAEERRSILA